MNTEKMKQAIEKMRQQQRKSFPTGSMKWKPSPGDEAERRMIEDMKEVKTMANRRVQNPKMEAMIAKIGNVGLPGPVGLCGSNPNTWSPNKLGANPITSTKEDIQSFGK